ncbi:MAG: GntR family transcriptional regulator [Deltaproteobacteria bacterium]|nr:GntR family transcriptional regulator [Deltaproteobacteria bacterium]
MLQIQSIVQNVREHLLNQLLHGNLHPGQQIKELEIASSLGISRPPIREALKYLEAEGLIVKKPNRGAFVATITEHDAWEIYTLKCNLYEMATRLAFERISKTDLQDWEEVLKEMEACVMSDPPDVIKYQSLNQKFHDILFHISGNQRLQRISQMLHRQMSRFSCMSLMDEEHLKGSLRYHQMILDTIKEGDMEGTIRVTREHILKGLDSVKEIIARETGSPGDDQEHKAFGDPKGDRSGSPDATGREPSDVSVSLEPGPGTGDNRWVNWGVRWDKLQDE